MTIQESISKSTEEVTIFIVKEALFCNVYEESAWRFSEFIKPYKPAKKTIKKLNMDVVSIGFPKSQLSSLLKVATQQGFSITPEETGGVSIKISREPEIPFIQWKEGIPLYRVKPLTYEAPRVGEPPTDYSSIIREIELFSVAHHTPMQAMLFLMEIQDKIKAK
jgi:hypothetical protein